MRKVSYQILVLTSSVLILSIVIALYVFSLKSDNSIVQTQETVMFCGTVEPALADKAIEGKKIFNTNCAACHKLDKLMTGPALRGVSKAHDYPYDNYLYEFLTKEDSLRKKNDSFTKALNSEYDYQYDHAFKLSQSDFNQLMTYIE